jgi:hypothetical protein
MPSSFLRRGPRNLMHPYVDVVLEARAVELEMLGEGAKANRVRNCGIERWNRPWYCRDRACPICFSARMWKHAMQGRKIARTYGYPQFVTLTFPVRLGKLESGMKDFRRALQKWFRRRAVNRVAQRCVGAIEPRLGADGRIWTLHVHLIMDALEPAPDFQDPRHAWRSITRRRGLLLEPKAGFRVLRLCDAVDYTRKPNDWCPVPSALPLKMLRELLRSTRWRQPCVSWGNRKAARPITL